MLIVTSDGVPGREISETLGLVFTRGRADHTSGPGGLGRAVQKSDEESHIFSDLAREAEKVGADAVVAVRFAFTEHIVGHPYGVAYGTAVKLA